MEVKPNFPTGEAKTLHELTRKRWQEHLILFSQVKNTVLTVNSEIEMPFKLEKGQPCPLGLFADTALRNPPQWVLPELPKGSRILEAWPKHGRSAILGRVIFKDRQGRLYRDIDLKGMGFINTPPGRKALKVWQPGLVGDDDKTRLGLLDVDIALADYQLTEEFLNAGIRTCRVMAVIGLEEIIAQGEKLSLKEARRAGIIDGDFKPAVEVRAFATRARITDITGSYLKQRRIPLQVPLDDARRIVGQELALETLSEEDYLKWFGKVLGQSVGLMHKNGWYHRYLNSHNITLDGRIVDLDSLTELTSYSQANDDHVTVKEAFINLIHRTRKSSVIPLNFVAVFDEAYEEAFPSSVREQYFTRQAEVVK
ncbi:hypothetical protein HYU45_00435 [Candidatus Daviesbacteria bacterium]|nr:hypothetical protein [Candidatus Daviesbacteria bacterium]